MILKFLIISTIFLTTAASFAADCKVIKMTPKDGDFFVKEIWGESSKSPANGDLVFINLKSNEINSTTLVFHSNTIFPMAYNNLKMTRVKVQDQLSARTPIYQGVVLGLQTSKHYFGRLVTKQTAIVDGVRLISALLEIEVIPAGNNVKHTAELRCASI